MRKYIGEFTGSQIDSVLKQSQQAILAAWPKVKSSLEAKAMALGAKSLAAPPDTASMLRGQIDLNTWEGSAIVGLWRTGSAAAHGFHWPDTTSLRQESLTSHRSIRLFAQHS